jgi:hypothetical protein
MCRFIIFSLLLFLPTFPAYAQGNDGGGTLSYTTLGARKERTGGHMNYRKLESDLPLTDGAAEKPEKPPPDQAAADKAWEKYKALAAGKYKEPEEKEAPREKTAVKEEPKPATGMAGIIEEYRRNKAQRSQMRTIKVTPPEKTEEPDRIKQEELKNN